MLTLWDLLDKAKAALWGEPASPAARIAAPAQKPRPAPHGRRVRRNAVKQPAKNSMLAKYDAVVQELLTTHNIRVRKWRTSTSGVAWQVFYRDGKVVNLIEAPRPRTPISMAIFLHEVGHHVIGMNTYKPRCLEEYHAWRYAIETMEQRGLPITDKVRDRMRRSLEYAVRKAMRRGIKRVPEELIGFLPEGTRLMV